MSSTNKTANYQLSQFVGNDIPSILNDYNGDMRKIDTAIKDVANAGGDNATAVAELQATVGQHTTEIGGINSTVNSLSGRVIGIEGKIPASASESNKLSTARDIPEIPSIAGLEQSVAELQEEVSDMGGDVKAIQLCVPANASESNKLVTQADIPELQHYQIYKHYNANQFNNDNALFDALFTDVQHAYAVGENYNDIIIAIRDISDIVDGGSFFILRRDSNAESFHCSCGCLQSTGRYYIEDFYLFLGGYDGVQCGLFEKYISGSSSSGAEPDLNVPLRKITAYNHDFHIYVLGKTVE